MVLENERSIIESIKNGDKESFAILYKYYIQDIYYFMFSRIFNRELAEDLCSITFLKVYENIGKFKYDNFRAWLYRIANNVLIDYIRKNKRLVSSESSLLEYFSNKQNLFMEGFDKEIDKNLMLDIIKKYLRKLKEKDAELIRLKYFLAWDNKVIAEFLNISENNVAVRAHRLIQKLTILINKKLK